ncbi:MAG: MXAN_6640 family putative metalloprotease [Bacteroidota bacterium]
MKSRKILVVLVFAVIFQAGLHAQTAARQTGLTRLLIDLQQGKSPDGNVKPPKCGTATMALILAQWDQMSLQQRAEFERVIQRPDLQTSRLSPSGRFRIHYDTTGANEPALLSDGLRVPNSHEAYVDSLGMIFDYCWTFEVDTLGFHPPPTDGTEGGGPEYDVYIWEYFGGTFGETFYDQSQPLNSGLPQRFTSFIRIENDFLGYRTAGMDGLRVTAAHEFHHGIQLGAYGLWSLADRYFNELTSAWMEDAVFTNVNDYFYDIPDYFLSFRDASNRSLGFTTFSFSFPGYERSIWGHFLAKRFGRLIMTDIWQQCKTEPVLQSMQDVLIGHGSDVPTEFSLFSHWNYFTADRADSAHYYPEGKFYPRFRPNISTTLAGPTMTMSSQAFVLSCSMEEFKRSADTVMAIVTNADLAAAQQLDVSPKNFSVKLTTAPVNEPHQILSDGRNAVFTADNPASWNVSYSLSSTSSAPVTLTAASPNPLNLNSALSLRLPVNDDPNTEAQVLLLSSSFDLLYSSEYTVTREFGMNAVVVPTADFRSKVASGVCFVFVKTQNFDYRWKVALIR